MALKDTYNESQKNKVKDKEVKMSLVAFMKEHVHLLKVLRTGTKEEQLKEADEQEQEMKKYA